MLHLKNETKPKQNEGETAKNLVVMRFIRTKNTVWSPKELPTCTNCAIETQEGHTLQCNVHSPEQTLTDSSSIVSMCWGLATDPINDSSQCHH